MVKVFFAVKTSPRGNLLLNGNPLKIVEKYNYLGFAFSAHGKFDAQVLL